MGLTPSPMKMFDPDGNVRAIPDDQVQAALGAGAKLAIPMTDPKGDMRYIPHDQVKAAQDAGAKVSMGDPMRWSEATEKEGFLPGVMRKIIGPHPLDAMANLAKEGTQPSTYTHPWDSIAAGAQTLSNLLGAPQQLAAARRVIPDIKHRDYAGAASSLGEASLPIVGPMTAGIAQDFGRDPSEGMKDLGALGLTALAGKVAADIPGSMAAAREDSWGDC